MQIKDKDMAVCYRIQLGMLRDGKAFLESERVENVSGDVPHNRCMGAIMLLAMSFLESFMNHHFGDQVQEVDVVPTVNDLISFFDRERVISDD